MSDSKLRQICDNSDIPWTCPPCKRKLCVNCNSCTHNKPKTSCFLCDNVCVGLPKAFKQTDWLCKTCRPSVFPFHNVDHKSLIKVTNNPGKYSLENLSVIASDMSRNCSVCAVALSRSNPGIPCFSCNCKVHVKCSKINDAKNTFHLFRGNWQCITCMRYKFPFTDIDNDSLLELATPTGSQKVLHEFSIDEKLKLLLSHSSKTNWYAHVSNTETDPHDSFLYKFEAKPNFCYYDVPDFRKTQPSWDRHNSLSIIHTNISSLQANVDNLDDLLDDLTWNFDVIALSETWNDENNKSNFTPKLLEGYTQYVGTTGSSQKGG